VTGIFLNINKHIYIYIYIYKSLVYVTNTLSTARPVLPNGRKPSTSRYLNLPPDAVHDCISTYRHVSLYSISFCEILL
jgi:hypothetical protein